MEWLYLIVTLTVGFVVQDGLAPSLQPLLPGWPHAIVGLIAALPGLVPMWIVGFWLYRCGANRKRFLLLGPSTMRRRKRQCAATQ